MKYYLYYLLLINLISFIVAIVDKCRALKGSWRIRESYFLCLAVLGGGVGLLLGLLISNHKTRKKKFMVGIPVIIAVQVVITALVLN